MYKSKKVMVVDDSLTTAKLMKRILKQIGFEDIITAKNGKEALDILKDVTVDIIISDWTMPYMDGMELFKKIRSSDQHKDTPFLMVTSEGLSQNKKVAQQAGITNFLNKPFNFELISKEISKIFVHENNKDDLLEKKLSSDDLGIIKKIIDNFMTIYTSIKENRFPVYKLLLALLDTSKGLEGFINNKILELESKSIPEALVKDGKSKKILIIDDDRINCVILKKLLTSLGYQDLDILTDCDSALGIIEKKHYNLIICDMHMPGLTGLDLLKIVKSKPHLADISFLLMTADNNPETIVKAIKEKIDHYIIKPVTIEMLKTKLKYMNF